MEISVHLFIALMLGAFTLGYLLAEWYFDSLLKKSEHKLKECADTIDDLLDNDERAHQLIDKLRSNIQFMDENAGKLLEKNRELQQTIRQHEAIFGPDALVSYKAMAEHVSQLEALLQLVPEDS